VGGGGGWGGGGGALKKKTKKRRKRESAGRVIKSFQWLMKSIGKKTRTRKKFGEKKVFPGRCMTGGGWGGGGRSQERKMAGVVEKWIPRARKGEKGQEKEQGIRVRSKKGTGEIGVRTKREDRWGGEESASGSGGEWVGWHRTISKGGGSSNRFSTQKKKDSKWEKKRFLLKKDGMRQGDITPRKGIRRKKRKEIRSAKGIEGKKSGKGKRAVKRQRKRKPNENRFGKVEDLHRK